jgi:hypothetical protein
MPKELRQAQADPVSSDKRDGDFAVENARPGFEASIPITAATDEYPGPFDGLDPDHPRPERWAQVRGWFVRLRRARAQESRR